MVEGAKGSGGIASLVERKNRYFVAAKLTDKAANSMTIASARAFDRIPKRIQMTLTVDKGKEFVHFKKLETQFRPKANPIIYLRKSKVTSLFGFGPSLGSSLKPDSIDSRQVGRTRL